MHLLLLSFAFLSLSSLATTTPIATPLITTLTRASHHLAYVLDTKNYSALSTILTQDVTFEEGSSKTSGFAETVAVLKCGVEGGEHRTPNHKYLAARGDVVEQSKGGVLKNSITLSHWVKDALEDPAQTYRIHTWAEDIWVLQGGDWKLQSTKVVQCGIQGGSDVLWQVMVDEWLIWLVTHLLRGVTKRNLPVR